MRQSVGSKGRTNGPAHARTLLPDRSSSREASGWSFARPAASHVEGQHDPVLSDEKLKLQNLLTISGNPLHACMMRLPKLSDRQAVVDEHPYYGPRELLHSHTAGKS